MINTSIPIFGELVDRLQLSLFPFSITKLLSIEFTSGNITTACLFGIVHYKFIAFNCLKVFENSTIGVLYKKIKIAQYRLHLTSGRENRTKKWVSISAQCTPRRPPSFSPSSLCCL
jgi:hypothetical protein